MKEKGSDAKVKISGVRVKKSEAKLSLTIT